MSPSTAASTLGRLGAQRHQLTREPVLQRARQMRAELGMTPDTRLLPELVLTANDRIC